MKVYRTTRLQRICWTSFKQFKQDLYMLTFLKRMAALLMASIPVLFLAGGCQPGENTTNSNSGGTDTIHNIVNWVSLFKPTTTAAIRTATLEKLKEELRAVNSKEVPGERDSVANPIKYYLYHYFVDSLKLGREFSLVDVQEYHCNCDDSLLWNLTAGIRTDSSGLSYPNPTPPPSKTKVQGDPFDALTRNDPMKDPKQPLSVLVPGARLNFPAGYSVSQNSVIAIIDTGIDTVRLDERLKANVLTGREGGSRNMMTGHNPFTFRDDHVMRHGTAVTAVAMNSFYNESGSKQLPKILSLKALDSTGSGNLFDFICALSYAIQQRVSVINASMGYYGEPNEILEKYLRKSTSDSIPVIAAAGNDTSAHTSSDCFNQLNASNLLNNPGHLFFPACNAFEKYNLDVISVTGFSAPGMPCYYQNYSNAFVTLAVMNQRAETGCCNYSIPFIDNRIPVSGSSFATPVVSGKLAYRLSGRDRIIGVRNYLAVMGGVINAPPGGSQVTMNNNYITY